VWVTDSWASWVAGTLDGIRDAGRWRAPRELDARGPQGRLADWPVISFASNDYLGLTAHPALSAAAHEALDRWGAGSGSARLVTGARPVHTDLEAALARWKGTDRAVLFPTGFAANLGALSTIGRPGVTLLSDELNHASLIDGCRLARASGAAAEVVAHADVDAFAAAARRACSDGQRVAIVTDVAFSMDGDVAPLSDLAKVAAEHGALLVLDEAHAVPGLHTSTELPADAAAAIAAAGGAVLRVGTLSKTLGSLGGFVATDHAFADLLVNAARSYIFTTASTPADSAAALAALRLLGSDAGSELVATLRRHLDRLMPGHPSPIVPVVLGDEERAVAASAALLERGLLVPAIRPPTVPVGSSRLRVTLSAAHTDAQVDQLLEGLAAIGWRP
jgi:8-amino-7-oxononanoate synthase